jgi:hypothetical protein
VSRGRIKCSSASLIVPLRPSTSRSLNSAGSYTPSASAINVSVSAHRSSSWYQSVLLRASRDASIPSTMPTLPSPTSATSSRNPVRALAEAPERPRSSSITRTWPSVQPSAAARSRNSYWRARLSVFCTICVAVDCRTYT